MQHVVTVSDDALIERIGFDAVLFLKFIRLLRNILCFMTFLGVCVLIPINITATRFTGYTLFLDMKKKKNWNCNQRKILIHCDTTATGRLRPSISVSYRYPMSTTCEATVHPPTSGGTGPSLLPHIYFVSSLGFVYTSSRMNTWKYAPDSFAHPLTACRLKPSLCPILTVPTPKPTILSRTGLSRIMCALLLTLNWLGRIRGW